MADNYEDPAGSTQMFRAFVETPAAEQRTNVSTHRTGAGSGGSSRAGMIALAAIVGVVVVVGVVWLAVK